MSPKSPAKMTSTSCETKTQSKIDTLSSESHDDFKSEKSQVDSCERSPGNAPRPVPSPRPNTNKSPPACCKSPVSFTKSRSLSSPRSPQSPRTPRTPVPTIAPTDFSIPGPASNQMLREATKAAEAAVAHETKAESVDSDHPVTNIQDAANPPELRPEPQGLSDPTKPKKESRQTTTPQGTKIPKPYRTPEPAVEEKPREDLIGSPVFGYINSKGSQGMITAVTTPDHDDADRRPWYRVSWDGNDTVDYYLDEILEFQKAFQERVSKTPEGAVTPGSARKGSSSKKRKPFSLPERRGTRRRTTGAELFSSNACTDVCGIDFEPKDADPSQFAFRVSTRYFPNNEVQRG